MENNKVYRPWGYFEVLDDSTFNYHKVKRIVIYPNSKLSLQSHKKRSEHWVVIYGNINVHIDGNIYQATKNSSFFIPINSIHRIENTGNTNAIVIETQIGDYLEEDDIIRYEDDYGRVN